MTGHLIDEIMEFWRSAVAFAADRRHRMVAAREMGALDPNERSRILTEAGLTRSEFGDIMRTPFVSQDLLSRAMLAIGIVPSAFRARHEMWHRDMARVCMACPARSRCRRDLATCDFARRYRHYCPNADSLAEIVAETRATAPLSRLRAAGRG